MDGSISEYAAHRRASGHRGCTKQAVHKAIGTGRIPASLVARGRILDFAATDAAWDANTREVVSAPAGAPAPARPPAPAPDSPDTADLPELPRPDADASPRQQKEHWSAVREEIKARKDAGELIPLAAARRVYLDAITMARAGLEVIPIRVCDRLVGLTAPEIRAMLTSEITSALKELSRANPMSTRGRDAALEDSV